MKKAGRLTRTGGREATTRHIPPKLALSVSMPSTPAPRGWKWSALSDLARLESGHTPSRNHPEYWGGDVPWISISDARAHDGDRIDDTEEKTNELGLANSSARLLPSNTVCLSRTASVGYVVVMGRPMATSQDFVNWICSEELDYNFLKYLFIAEDEGLLRFASGSVHQTIYFPEVKAFHICHPSLPEQQRIVGVLDEAFAGLATAQAHAEKNLQNARELFDSYLEAVFAQRGEGWAEKTMEEVAASDCSLSYGIVQPGDEVVDGLPVVRPTDLTHTTIKLDGLKRIDPKCAESYQRTMLQGGELLLCVRGSTGVISKAASELKGANVTRGIVPIRLNPKLLCQDFGFHLLRAEPVQTQIKAKTYGAALMQINIGDLRKIAVAFPPLNEQRAIATQLDTLAAETQRLTRIYEQKQAALAELKKSLLHQAFSGEL